MTTPYLKLSFQDTFCYEIICWRVVHQRGCEWNDPHRGKKKSKASLRIGEEKSRYREFVAGYWVLWILQIGWKDSERKRKPWEVYYISRIRVDDQIVPSPSLPLNSQFFSSDLTWESVIMSKNEALRSLIAHIQENSLSLEIKWLCYGDSLPPKACSINGVTAAHAHG